MSGMSNVRYYCEKRGIPVDDALCQAILARAKSCAWTLTDEEVAEIIAAQRQAGGGEAGRAPEGYGTPLPSPRRTL